MNHISRFTQFFLHHLYRELAWFYDSVAYLVSFGRWQTWISSVLPFIKGPNVLETGFGPGHLLNLLNNQRYFVFGLDESHQMAQLAKKRWSKQQENNSKLPNITIGKTQNLPYPDNFFDTVVATFPTAYIYQPDTIEEFFRVLKPGASLIALLSAEIQRPDVLSKITGSLYTITGQSSMNIHPLIDIYSFYQFDLQIAWIDVPSGKAYIMKAKKRLPFGR